MNIKWQVIKTGIKQYRAYKKFMNLSEEKRKLSSIPQEFVEDILELGATYTKIGQVLSTRPDILPVEYISALERLQENVPSFEYEIAVKIIEKELNNPISQLFKSIEQKPLASASLSQVHTAILLSGEEVVLKIQRPGLEQQMQKELNTLGQLVSFARFFNRKLFSNLNLIKVFQEFKRYTLKELDFSLEGKTYDRFRKNFIGDQHVVFPKIYWEYTTPRILTMEKLSGWRLQEIRDKMPFEVRKKLSNNIITALINMFVRDGFFHADLHPGNIFFQEDGSVAIIDVGMFGELTTEQRERFILYWLAIVLKEKKRAYNHLMKLSNRTSKSDEAGFYIQYEQLLDCFYNSSIQKKSLTQTYLEILVTGARFGFGFPSEMLLQAKALTTAEHIGYVLVPDFNFAEAAKPMVADAFVERFSSGNIISRISSTSPEWLLLGEQAPESLLSTENTENYLWKTAGEYIAKQWDDFHEGAYQEIRHGEYSVEIDKDLETVFNFVSRFAQYPFWHPIYTEDSHVIHVSGEYIFITPEVVGSVFRLDEIVDGYHLLSNGVITHFDKNKLMKWKAPFSVLPLIELGTCLEFEPLQNGKTKLSEYFFFSESPLKHVFVNRKWFSVKALTNHIREELTGVKNILESGKYSANDIVYLWKNVKKPVRFLSNESFAIDHINGGPLYHSIETATTYVKRKKNV